MRIAVLGALGEVGSRVSEALALRHEVLRVSSRPNAAREASIAHLDSFLADLERGALDAVLNAAGPGDRRASERSLSRVEAVAGACRASGVPAIAVSTVRVLEGYGEIEITETAEPRPESPYAEANARHETAWLAAGGSLACVLRLANVLVLPSDDDSPQMPLLPWSLASEAVATGSITVRSAPSLAKGFVNADDIARAVELLAGASDRPMIAATTPASSLSLERLADSVSDGLHLAGLTRPRLSFGSGGSAGPAIVPGWLDTRGWSASVTSESVRDLVVTWLQRRAS